MPGPLGMSLHRGELGRWRKRRGAVEQLVDIPVERLELAQVSRAPTALLSVQPLPPGSMARLEPEREQDKQGGDRRHAEHSVRGRYVGHQAASWTGEQLSETA